MANYNDLKTGIDAVIKTNGRQEISGAALNTQLKNMIAELGAGYQYMGVATPATNPGTPDANMFYLASEAGTYTNFRGIVINEGEVCALVWNGSWTKQVTGAATAAQVNQLGQEIGLLSFVCTAENGGTTNCVYCNLSENDKILIGLSGTGASIRTVDLYVNGSWISYEHLVFPGEISEFIIPQNAQRIRFYTWGTNINVYFTISGIKQELAKLEENKVTSWGDEPSNEKYPSEKLVFDTFKDFEKQVGLKEPIVISKDSAGTFDTYNSGLNFTLFPGLDYTLIVENGAVSSFECYNKITDSWETIFANAHYKDSICNFAPTAECTRFRVYFSSAGQISIYGNSGINFLERKVADYDGIKQIVDLIPGINKTVTKDSSGNLDNINVPIYANVDYLVTCLTATSFRTIECFNNETQAFVVLNNTRVYKGDSIVIRSDFSSERLRISFDGPGDITIKAVSFTSSVRDSVDDIMLAKNWSNLLSPITVADVLDHTTLCTKLNALFTGDYKNLCLCSQYSFRQLFASDEIQTIYDDINHNFRDTVVVYGMTPERIAKNINSALQKRIQRFNDAILNVSTPRHFSLSTGLQGDEPSAIVSNDGNKLYIYAHLKRIETTDGVNWSAPITLTLNGGPSYILHCGVNYIDGVFYLIGCEQNIGGALHLFTSTDGLNFTYRGILFNAGFDFNNGYRIKSWGNPYLIKEYGSGKLYLYIEITPDIEGISWQICLVTYTNIFQENQDGTIGDHSIDGINNPIITGQGSVHLAQTAGNVDFAKLDDNRPLKHNGKYFIYYHGSQPGNVSTLFRACSIDLVNWDIDGICYDNRDQPTAGDNTSGNADHCVIEFKGRTYLFYSWNINTTLYQPYIKYTVDDRHFETLLSLRP